MGSNGSKPTAAAKVSRRGVLGVTGALLGAAAAEAAPAKPGGRFAGKVAVITGGARGMGRSHAVALAREGATIVACDILEQIPTAAYPLATQADMDATAKLVADAGGRFVGVKADVRDPKAADAVVARAVNDFGKVDFLLANAGIYATKPLAEVSDQMFDDIVRTNLYGVFNIMRAALPQMTRQKYGRIVATSSQAGRMGFADTGAYGASKWGVIGLVKSTALEVVKQGVTVNCVCPTAVNTPLVNNAIAWRATLAGDPAPTKEKYEAKMRANPYLPQGVPWVEPEEVTSAILFLLSDEAKHITGIALDVTAGGSASYMA
jgi:SDR family mycofactocin-dependent oxidoreductase